MAAWPWAREVSSSPAICRGRNRNKQAKSAASAGAPPGTGVVYWDGCREGPAGWMGEWILNALERDCGPTHWEHGPAHTVGALPGLPARDMAAFKTSPGLLRWRSG